MGKNMLEYNVDGQLIRYRPAELTKGKTDWYVHFSTPDPLKEPGKLYRKRIKINYIKNKKEREKYAHLLREDINRKLRNGWNPWLEEQAPKGNTKLIEAMQIFLRRKEREGLRPDSIRTYVSKVKLLTEWLIEKKHEQMVVAAFTDYHASEYMDAVLNRNDGTGTYNNTVTVLKVVFNWLKDGSYCVQMPFDKIKPLKKQPKKRKVIPMEWREKIRKHLATNHPDFLRSCMLMFYAQIRPAEQTRLILANVNLTNRTIYVPDSAAKTCTGRYATIPDALLPYLHSIEWDRIPKNLPLIGNKFAPGAKKLTDTRKWNRTWRKEGDKIGLPKEYQFYSLRDSGIIYLFEQNIPANQVMAQAGHTSLATTTKYIKHANVSRVKAIGEMKAGF